MCMFLFMIYVQIFIFLNIHITFINFFYEYTG